jgi:aspartyl-tRNA(Asn)/glutamyl-tRNA(Gln) amidotransferase subunit A
MIQQKLKDIKSGKLTAEENIKNFLKRIEKEDKKVNSFLYINKNAIKEAKEIDNKIKKGKAGKLAGLAIAIKSNINVLDMPISCASKTLENYYGTYDADVVKKIKAEDGVIIGMLNMDEFASGSSGESSAFSPTKNPKAKDRIPGGSSSGSAAAVAADFCDIALGSDTGGSIRNPASHCGVIGIKPSYGRVSRYGLIDLSMSLDQIGPLCKDVYGAALMLEVISGKSKYDPTTYDEPVKKYTDFKLGKIKIGMSKSFEKLCKEKKIYDIVEEKANDFANKFKTKVKNINLKYVDLTIQTYYPIVYVEFFSGTRKLDGRKYGKKIEESCGEEVLRRILGGKEISKAEYKGTYYRKALMVKELIKKEFEKAFKEVDIIVLPTTPILPHKLKEKITDPRVLYAYDAFTIPANLAGFCSGVINSGEIDGIPVGMQIFAPWFKEDLLFSVLKEIENL